jgi:starch phosphorylase
VGRVKLYLLDSNDLSNLPVHRAITSELYGGGPELRFKQEMKRVRQLAGASGGYVYSAAVSAARPPADYTARVIPHCDGVAIPLEDERILWQR